MKLTVIYMNYKAVEMSLQTNYKFDPCYRSVSIELTEEQIAKLQKDKQEMVSIMFFDEESREE